MKLISSPKQCAGSALIVALGIGVILSTALISYMRLAQGQQLSIARSQSWNGSLVIAEAGVEDGLSFVNKYNGYVGQLLTWTNASSISADNATNLGNNVFYYRRTMPNGYYDIYVTNSNPFAPIISVAGHLAWSLNSGGTNPYTNVTRNVVINTQSDGMFAGALASLSSIDLKGNNITTDSFDSGDTNWSAPGGFWPDPAVYPGRRKANGDVDTNDQLISTGSISVQNADIMGHVRTGPLGTVSIGAQGSVGDTNFVLSGTSGFEAGYTNNDFNVYFPNVDLPNVSWWTLSANGFLTSGTVNGVTYNYILYSFGGATNYYQINNLSGNVYVPTNAHVVLRLNGTTSMSGSAVIRLANTTGTSLQIYANGSVSLSGNATIDNPTGKTDNLMLFGTTNCTSMSLGGNAAFTGGLYAPAADLTMGGGGNTTYDFIGSVVAKSITMNGHFNFHYDEAMQHKDPARGFIARDWKEF